MKSDSDRILLQCLSDIITLLRISKLSFKTDYRINRWISVHARPFGDSKNCHIIRCHIIRKVLTVIQNYYFKFNTISPHWLGPFQTSAICSSFARSPDFPFSSSLLPSWGWVLVGSHQVNFKFSWFPPRPGLGTRHCQGIPTARCQHLLQLQVRLRKEDWYAGVTLHEHDLYFRQN